MNSIENILKTTKNIAIIGLSDKPDRASYQVAQYFISEGFNVIPVNPTIESVFGIKSYPSFSDIPPEIKIDIVDIFRKSDEVLAIVKEVLQSRINNGQKPIVWFQEGVLNLEAENLAKQNGMEVISGICLMKAHKK